MSTEISPEESFQEDQPTLADIEESVIDQAALDQILAIDPHNGHALLDRIIDTFCDTAAEIVDNLIAAANSDDMAGVASAAHSLKSSSASVGALRLSTLSRDMEADAKSNDTAAIREAAVNAKQEFNAAAAELRLKR